MNSVYNFIVEPKGERYNNSIDIGDKKLIINTEIFNHQYVNREAVVISTPKVNNTEIVEGDTVLVHHNVFRRWYDTKGRERNSKSYFEDNKYIISADQIFLHKVKTNWSRFKTPIWEPLRGFCFVQPIKSKDKFNTELEHETKGIIKYTDGSFELNELVGFEPFSKYEFIVDGQRLYRVYSKFITIKYEYQGNEEAYNPSWA